MGSQGADVMFLQCLLNKRNANPRLAEDGSFGSITRTAVMNFQRVSGGSAPDGIVGPNTWARFGPLTERLHPVTLFGQPTDMTCWSAAATMVLGNMSVGSGGAQTGSSGGLSAGINNIETFLSGLGWRLANNQSNPPLFTLLSQLRQNPLWVAFEGGSFQHAVVFSGFYCDAANDESTTVFRIHDPWPPGRGTVYGSTYRRGLVSLRSIRPPRQAVIQYVASPR